MKPIEPSIVKQGHCMGCGVACVASVLNVTYKEALQLFKHPEDAWTKGYICKDIVNALAKASRKYGFKKIHRENDPILKITGTIIFADYCDIFPEGHYLVKVPKGYMNPWVNFPEIDPVQAAITPHLPSKAAYAIYQKNL